LYRLDQLGQAATKHADLEAQYRTDLESRLDKNRTKALTFPKVSKDPGMDLLVRRDAIDRASRPLDSRGLGDLLELARLGDDEVLAVATLRRAYELTDDNTVGAFLTNYPDRAPAWNLFMATAEEYNMLEAEGISSLVGAFPPEQPTEIGGSPFTSRGTARDISDVEATLDRISSSFAMSQAPPEPAESASEEAAS
jgi:hypothetical protein